MFFRSLKIQFLKIDVVINSVDIINEEFLFVYFLNMLPKLDISTFWMKKKMSKIDFF